MALLMHSLFISTPSFMYFKDFVDFMWKAWWLGIASIMMINKTNKCQFRQVFFPCFLIEKQNEKFTYFYLLEMKIFFVLPIGIRLKKKSTMLNWTPSSISQLTGKKDQWKLIGHLNKCFPKQGRKILKTIFLKINILIGSLVLVLPIQEISQLLRNKFFNKMKKTSFKDLLMIYIIIFKILLEKKMSKIHF